MHITTFQRRERALLLRYISQHPQLHQHLDWQPVQKWLPDPANSIALAWEGDILRGVMAFSPVLSGISWLRLLGLPRESRDETFTALWDYLCAMLTPQHPYLAVLIARPWVSHLLERYGFRQMDTVMNLVRASRPIPAVEAEGITLRNVRFGESSRVLAVDHAAFKPLWQMQAADLQEAGNRASHYTVAIAGRRMVGYQLSMRYDETMHLARIATVPEMQGRGVASLLLADMLAQAERLGVEMVTVNTQASNTASRQLYARFGFQHDTPDLPVLGLQL